MKPSDFGGLEIKVCHTTLAWICKYCDDKIKDETEFYEQEVRALNDSYRNGAHAGTIRTLKRLKEDIETIVSISKMQDH